MRWILFTWALLPAFLWPAGVAPDTATKLRQAGLDGNECYRVREINFSKEDVRIYLTEGYLIFGKPLDGKRYSAVFSTDVKGGDGELLVMPPLRSERLSLATFTKSPNLNEHFKSAVMLFTDNTAAELLSLVKGADRVRPSPEMGIVLERKWNGTVNNLAGSFGNRMVYDVLLGRGDEYGFFYSAFTGTSYGNFDFIHDPVASEQVHLGQVRFRNNRAYFDTWTSFEGRSYRTGRRQPFEAGAALRDYKIEATLREDLLLEATTKATLTVQGSNHNVLHFDVSQRMEMLEVFLDGEPCEVWQRESLRADLLRRGDNAVFLVIPPRPVEEGHAYEMEFRHQGRVVSDAGNRVYYVGSRATWYPRLGLQFSTYDITFRYPNTLNLVFAGEVLEDRTDGEWRITRRKTESPVRLAGFNIGDYEHVKAEHPGFAIEVYANRNVEQALQPKQRLMIVPRTTGLPNRRRRGVQELVAIPAAPVRRDPTARIEPLANEIANDFAFMSEHFGPPPARTLMVSPIPGTFGQGFPGLLYLSTMSYLAPEDRPKPAQDDYHELFYSEILHAHETAHQWWGNIVSVSSYQDEWLMEALANYSALLLLETRKGPEVLNSILDIYRTHLLAKNDEGKTVESAGPICWGPRLNSSQARAWRVITYEKGSWIIHMLRRRMGDDAFLAMLGELCRRYRFRTISLDEFRELASEFLPEGSPDPTLEHFFDQWVRAVGIPDLKFNPSIKGQAPRVRVFGNVHQSDVTDDFSVDVPIELQFDTGESIVRWIRTGSEPEPFDVTVRRRPNRVIFNPGESVLTR